MGKSTPKAPDPVKVSAAQTESNKDTAGYNAALNRIDQTSPFGSIKYTQNGTDPTTGAPLYTQNTSLSPELQGLLNSQIGAQGGIADAISGAIGNLPQGQFDPSGIDTSSIAKASYDSQVARLQPQFDEGFTKLEGMLSDRGLPIGSEIANNEFTRYDRARNDSLTQASRQAELDASNEYQRQFGNLLTQHNLPLQQLQGLMGTSSPVQNPTFSPFAQSSSANTDTASNTWAAYNANLNQANQQNGQFWNGLLGVGQAAMAFSDIRLKRDIRRIGALPSGLPVYSYRYVFSNEPQVGVMAQEAIEMFPHAISVHDSGYLQVNYALIS